MNTLQYILAGNATFTILNTQTNCRFTFKVTQPKKTSPHFVKVLTGSDNDNDYTFMGTIFDSKVYRHSKRNEIDYNAKSCKAFRWVWERVLSNTLPDYCQIYHEGTCGRCGRTLTVPESIESGFGPECIKLI